jgi:hypothetical protein
MLALLAVVCACRASLAAPAGNEDPRAYCARVGDDDELRAPPRSLAPAIHRLFNIGGAYALQTTYYRCAGGDVLLCAVGANLPCGKADTSTAIPAATQWCEMHESSNFIPMVVTGHDTLYSWRCVGRTAEAGDPIAKVDSRGFFVNNWKKLK